MKMLDLVYVSIWDDYALYMDSYEKDPNYAIVFTDNIKYVLKQFVVPVDEGFHLIYDGHKGLGKGLETELHHKYDNQ